MSYKNNFGRNGSNFTAIEDVDDSTFLNHPRQGSKGYILSSNDQSSSSTVASLNEKRMQILQEKRRLENETLNSTKQSLALIYETEKIGVSTAEELLHQREQLENVNDKLDSINSIMRVSQKHLNSMKSMFGGFKSMFSKSTEKPPTTKLPSSVSDSKLAQSLNSTFKNNTQAINDSRVKHNYDTSNNISSTTSSNPFEAKTNEIDKEIDNNLEEIGVGICKLKELALGLGNEIDTQNKMLDTIAVKSEKAQDIVANQNRQMNRILKN